MTRTVNSLQVSVLLCTLFFGGMAREVSAKVDIFIDLPRSAGPDYPADVILSVDVYSSPTLDVRHLTFRAEGVVGSKRVTRSLSPKEWSALKTSPQKRQYLVARPNLPAGNWLLSVHYDRVITHYKDGKPAKTNVIGVTQLYAMNPDGTLKTRWVEGAKYHLWLRDPVYLGQATEEQQANAIRNLLRKE